MTDSRAQAVIAYIGLGSNLDDPIRQIGSARAACAALPGVAERAFSSLYRSSPMGPQDQPDYINAVMAVASELAAPDLLHQLQRIEREHGRIRTHQRWSARTLDLDLLIYGEQHIDTDELTVPHPGLAVRAFVLYPLLEIAPDLAVPGLGRIDELVLNCPLDGLQRLT